MIRSYVWGFELQSSTLLRVIFVLCLGSRGGLQYSTPPPLDPPLNMRVYKVLTYSKISRVEKIHRCNNNYTTDRDRISTRRGVTLLCELHVK